MHKRLQLDAEEVLRGLRESAGAGRSSSGGTSAPSTGFFSRFGRVLLDNLRLTLINVHVRVSGAGDVAARRVGGVCMGHDTAAL